MLIERIGLLLELDSLDDRGVCTLVEGQTYKREKTLKKEWTKFLKDDIPKNEKKMTRA